MLLPLEGVRVLDLTRALAGPFCTMILADFGADVAKVEPVPRGDLLRQYGPFQDGESVYYLSVNRNKRSLALDFRRPEGLALLAELTEQADVLVENFKPGATSSMGLAYEGLRTRNPGLVYCSITGFGDRGPYGQWPGVDQIAQGMSGLMSITGLPGSGPVRVGIPIGDLVAGMWAALGVLGAVHQRRATGVGQRVEISLLASLVGLLCVQGQRYLSLGEVPGPTGNDHPVICPYGMFQANDGAINVAAATQDMWQTLCRLLGLPDLAGDPDYADNAARMDHRDALRERLDRAFATRTQAEWTHALTAAGIPAGPIYRMDQVFGDPQVRETGLVEQVEHPKLGTLPQLGNPARLEALGGRSVRSAPPMLGQHTEPILADWGVSRDRIAQLRRAGIVRTPEEMDR